MDIRVMCGKRGKKLSHTCRVSHCNAKEKVLIKQNLSKTFQQEPVKSAEEVIKEIDDLIEESDAEDEDVSEHGNQVRVGVVEWLALATCNGMIEKLGVTCLLSC